MTGLRPRLRLACLLGMAVGLAGCDLLGPEVVEVSGVVVNASEGGVPVEGAIVVLRVGGSGWGSYPTVAEAVTDAQGRYRLRCEGCRGAFLEVHTYPFGYDYFLPFREHGVVENRDALRRIELYRTTTLTVQVELERPLLGGERYWVDAGCQAIHAPVTSMTGRCFRANAYNEVTVRVRRYGQIREWVDSVYCPLDSVTVHALSL